MTVAELWEVYQPRIAAAKDQDRREADEVLLPYPELVGGIWVEPITIERLLLLEAVEHPVLRGGDLTRNDVLNFFWICSPDFVAGNPKKAKKYFRKFWRVDLNRVGEELGDHLKAEFEASTGSDSPPPANWIITLIDALASEYGWAEDRILALPLRRAFAYAHAMMSRKGSKEIPIAKHADKVRHEYLHKIDEIRQAKADANPEPEPEVA